MYPDNSLLGMLGSGGGRGAERERNNARAGFLGPRRSVQPGASLPPRLALGWR